MPLPYPNALFGFNTTQKAELIKYIEYVLADEGFATSIANINAGATALATKLNADAGVTDTNYDTNWQA
jgi:hypothetical protein